MQQVIITVKGKRPFQVNKSAQDHYESLYSKQRVEYTIEDVKAPKVHNEKPVEQKIDVVGKLMELSKSKLQAKAEELQIKYQPNDTKKMLATAIANN